MLDTPNARSDLSQMLRAEAQKLGFEAVGIARLSEDAGLRGRLAHFLNENRHGDMDWMETHADRRGDPLRLWPEAKSAVVFGQSYAPPDNPLEALGRRSNAAISVYAKGRDYHDVLKKRIKSLARSFARKSSNEVKVFVDTAPLMEKPLAAKAGLGWQGKHTILVSRDYGNWLFLGVMLTTADLEPDESISDHCGSCRRCLDICPTNAFPAPYQLDARRCIAYLTIEHKGHIAPEFRVPIGNRVFGCDDCAAVCPWNKFAGSATEMKYAARSETDNPRLAELLALDDATFRLRFAGTPIKRTGRDRIVRNTLIAAGNSGDRTLLPLIEVLIGDASPLVRAMAVWAVRRLADPQELYALQQRYERSERDPVVAAEWLVPIEGRAA
jgi:epoxyqueuosine reductase